MGEGEGEGVEVGVGVGVGVSGGEGEGWGESEGWPSVSALYRILTKLHDQILSMQFYFMGTFNLKIRLTLAICHNGYLNSLP